MVLLRKRAKYDKGKSEMTKLLKTHNLHHIYLSLKDCICWDDLVFRV